MKSSGHPTRPGDLREENPSMKSNSMRRPLHTWLQIKQLLPGFKAKRGGKVVVKLVQMPRRPRVYTLTLGWTLGFDSHNPISWVNNYKIITLVQHHLGSIQQSGSLPPLVCLMSSKDPYYTPIRWHSCFLTSRAWLCWLVTLPWPNQFHYSGYSPSPGKAVPLNFSSCSNRSIACTPAKVPFKVHLFQAII